jgi:dTDP-3-amino-3,4,6-trideoxy-alpha-D-glucose transaminase
VDTDERGLIDLDRARDAIRKLGIRYLVPVYLYGYSLDLGALERLRDEFSLAIVEDCAQSAGARFHGRATGTVGQIAATSFYPTKNLGAMGDGGAILTNDAALAAQARVLRSYGETERYRHERLGYNSRLDELQAAILREACLPRLNTWTKRRRVIADAYRAGLRRTHIRIPDLAEGCEPSWHLFPIQVAPPQRARLIEHLKAAGIAAGIHYPLAIPDQSALASVPHEVAHEILDGCENARHIAASEVSLPIHAYLTDEEVGAVIEVVDAWSPSGLTRSAI